MIVSLPAAEIHPDLRSPSLADLLRPSRAQWAPRDLLDLTATVASELTTPLLDILRYDRDQRWWTRLALTGGVEVWLLSWLPGQRTEPHDHGGAAGGFTVLLGALTERYRYPGGSVGVRRHAAGQGIGFGASHAHQVHNGDVIPAASVHAYSPPLMPTREFPSLGDAPATIASPASAAEVALRVREAS